MRTFTKLCFLVFALTFSAALFAQQNIHNHIGAEAIDKMEMIQQLHGPTAVVPMSPEGLSRAVGDDCTNPIIIPGLPFLDEDQFTTGRGNNYDNTCLNDFDEGEDIIYELELAETSTIYVSIDPKGTPHTGVAISDGCPLTSTCLAISYDLYNGGTDPHGFTVTLDAGFYYIMVDTWPNPTSIDDFNLTVEEVASVPNDDCEDAIVIGEVINYPFSTTLATTVSPDTASGPNIWFDYVPTFDGWAVIDLCGSDYDTYLIVWDGAVCPPVDKLTWNDDFCGYDGWKSKVFIEVNAGNVYKIDIGGFTGSTGDGLLSIYEYEDCELISPPGAVAENELCGTDINGGCSMELPAFTAVTNGTTIFGNLWSEFGTRDTDWFELELTTPGSIKMTVETEETVIFGLVGQQELGVPGCNNVTNFLSVYEILPACQEDFIQMVYLPKGTYYFFVAPMDYFAHPCPGFSYLATFETEELESGFISGVVLNSDGGSPIEGVKVTAGDYSATTNATGNYLLELPTGTYDVTADGYEVGFSIETATDVVVTDGNITTKNFMLAALPAPVLLSAVPDIEEVALEWEPIGSKAEGSKTLMGDIVSNNDYDPGETMYLDFTMTIYSPDFEWGDSATMFFPTELKIVSATALNGVPATIVNDQNVYWSGYFYTDDLPEEIDFSVEVEVDPLAEGPLVVDYYVEGDGFGLDPHYFEGAFTIYEEGGAYVPTFSVYRKLGPIGNNNTFIPIAFGVIGNNYVDVIPPGGEEWCYLVKQVMEDKSLSPASNAICVVPLMIPGSSCEDALLYSVVNDPPYPESLVRDEDERWFEFEVPYTMDVAIALTYAEFDPSVELYADCDGTLVEFEEFCGGMDYDLEQAYQFLPGGTYYARVSSLDGFGDFEIYISQIQVLTIREGWSGFSTYMDPAGDLDIASQLDCLADDMTITVRQNPYGIWWPSQNLNTIGDIYNTFGYKAKMDVEGTTVIYGTETADKTVALPFGSSYLPVRVSAPTPSSDILAQLNDEMLLVYDINEPSNVIWPDGGLNTLDFLVPGHAYLINMFVASSYTYPMPTMAPAPVFNEPPAMTKSSVWNEVINTGNPHFISIHQDALVSIETGDIIGVFDADGRCVGITEYTSTEGNLFMPAFGNDELTESKDGLLDGEKMTYKLFRGSNNTVYEVEVVYSEDMPNTDGLYELHGMSMIVELKVGSTSIFDAQLSAISVYPNPTNGLLNITGLDNEVEVTITNIHGQVISRQTVNKNTTIDLSAQSRGVYFVKMMTEQSTRIEKIVLR